MDGLYILFGGMILMVTIIGTLDVLGRRQRRRAKHEASLGHSSPDALRSHS
jgi:hypothetical protein